MRENMNRPVYQMLREASRRASGHMPGHKGKAPFGPVDFYALDTTELPLTDDLYAPERGLKEAQERYARAVGAASTLFLHNGSTCGIHVMMQLWAREGDTVLLPRNAHLSAVNGCVLGGVRVRWIPVRQTEDGYCYVAPADVLAALEQHPEAKALLLTRPDYYGGRIRLQEIVEKAHSMGIRVCVDEAHGAHMPWMHEEPSAGALGADAWVQSVHKTLPGLTGAAVLHLRQAQYADAALRIVRREQTSSPSFLLMMSIDDARAYMEEQGWPRLRQVIDAADMVRSSLASLGYREAHAMWHSTGQSFDPTRLVIDAPQGGAKLARQLQERGVDVEMHDLRRVVLILSAMDEMEEILRLRDVLAAISPEASPVPLLPLPLDIPERAMEVRQAAMANTEAVPVAQAVGRIAAASAGLYPPGIPLVCPGEIINEAVADRLLHAKNQERFGVEGDCLLCVGKNV